MKRKHFIIFVVIIAAVGLCWLWFNKKDASAPSSNNSSVSQDKSDNPNTPPKPQTFDKQKYSIDDPSSPWVIVNKKRPLQPATYAPSDLTVPNIPLSHNITSMEKQVRKETAVALARMITDGNNQGVKLNLQSGYRSYNFQVSLYNRYVQQQGKAVADTQSARPGHSEHQTGFAADLGSVDHPNCDVEACFGETAEGKWLAANAYKYGFVIRYQQGQDATTGYIYEPWHIRYVGVELATEVHNQGSPTLEVFFGLPKAPDYD